MSSFFKKTLSFFGFSDEESNKSNEVEKIGRKGRADNKDRNKRGSSRRNLTGHGRKVPPVNTGKFEARSRVFVSKPDEFEEVQIIADKFKNEIPIVVNLQKVDQDLSKRIIDFCGGLTYALEGSIKKVADKVFLIIPYNVEVNSEESEILVEESLSDPDNNI